MTKQIHAKIVIDLPSGTEEAAVMATIAVAWKQFTDTVGSTGVKVWGPSFEMKRPQGPRFGPPRIVKSGDAA